VSESGGWGREAGGQGREGPGLGRPVSQAGSQAGRQAGRQAIGLLRRLLCLLGRVPVLPVAVIGGVRHLWTVGCGIMCVWRWLVLMSESLSQGGRSGSDVTSRPARPGVNQRSFVGAAVNSVHTHIHTHTHTHSHTHITNTSTNNGPW
jgi:hypothetical protein